MECEVRRELLQAIVNGSPSQYRTRLQALREMARQYQTNPLARSLLNEAIAVAQRLRSITDEEAEIFRESFIVAQDRPRRISERHYMSPRTVLRIRLRVFDRMMPLVFGVDGIPFN